MEELGQPAGHKRSAPGFDQWFSGSPRSAVQGRKSVRAVEEACLVFSDVSVARTESINRSGEEPPGEERTRSGGTRSYGKRQT